MLPLSYRKDDWQDKRLAMDDRYGRSDFGRPDRYQDFDHRDRGRYHDDILMDRSVVMTGPMRGLGFTAASKYYGARSCHLSGCP